MNLFDDVDFDVDDGDDEDEEGSDESVVKSFFNLSKSFILERSSCRRAPPLLSLLEKVELEESG